MYIACYNLKNTSLQPVEVKGLLCVEVLQGCQSSFHVQTSLFSVVKQLELRSAYFERYCRYWLSFTELNKWTGSLTTLGPGPGSHHFH